MVRRVRGWAGGLGSGGGEMRRVVRWMGVAGAAMVVAAGVGLALLPGRAPPGPTPGHAGETLRFPDGFGWGVATAGQQIESQQPSDWTAFENDAVRDHRTRAAGALGTTLPGHIRAYDTWSDAARHGKTGFDTLYPRYFAEAEAMGVTVFRFSIDWARLFPRAGMSAPDPAGIAFYKAVIAEMKRHHIAPLATLFHVASPAWFWERDGAGRRGWERADALDLWRAHVRAVAENFIPDIALWCTLNEPMVAIYNGYLDGTYPPLERRGGPEAAVPVMAQLLRAHALAYRMLHEVAAARQAPAQVGIAQNVNHFVPLRNFSPLDRVAAAVVTRAWNWDFLDAIETGTLRPASGGAAVPIDGLRGTEDFVGPNYYSRIYMHGAWRDPANPKPLLHDAGEAVTELGWTIDPHGLYGVLAEGARRYGKPIWILENGTADAADDDVTRQKYLVEHVREIWLAMHEAGADVRGYLQWSLMDNMEWTEGFDARFGLIAVDPEHPDSYRPRKSAAVFTAIARANALDPALQQRYAPLPYPRRAALPQ